MLLNHKFVFLMIILFAVITICGLVAFLTSYTTTGVVLYQKQVGNHTYEIRGNFIALKNYINGDERPPQWNASVTYTTHASPEFIHHIVELADRWDGFISLALYTPGKDFYYAILMAKYFRFCYPRVRQRVNWHFIYDSQFQPDNKYFLPETYAPPETIFTSCNSSYIPLLEKNHTWFRHNKSLMYPINVLRNVARSASKTKYVLASDIELYPSTGFVSTFMDLITRERNGQVHVIDPMTRHVYMLPIFEVNATVEAPKTKHQLRILFATGQAIFFHQQICDYCQKFPNRDLWINRAPTNSNTLNIFAITKRTGVYKNWEPIYVGTNDEPFYDERFSWEGQRDKMSQMYELCLLDYDFLVLDNAFLVHSPGIKTLSEARKPEREHLIQANNRLYTSLVWSFKLIYGLTNKCD